MVDAGDFTTWLTDLRAALTGARDAAVPCGDCVACCTSAQFVPIGPDEVDTLAAIPKKLRFPAPHRPGWWLLPYDARGHCAMFRDGRCAIYARRPRTCRAFDCRVLPATGLGDPERPAIDAQARRWRFTFDAEGQARHAAARAAAAAIAARPDRPPRPHQIAAIALAGASEP